MSIELSNHKEFADSIIKVCLYMESEHTKMCSVIVDLPYDFDPSYGYTKFCNEITSYIDEKGFALIAFPISVNNEDDKALCVMEKHVWDELQNGSCSNDTAASLYAKMITE